MSKHPKPGGSKPHPDPNNNNACNEKRSISGDVHVRGEVVVEFGPEETNARDSSEKKEDARKRKTWWLEVATFIVLSIYAWLTAWQACTTQQMVTLTRTQFTSGERPFIIVTSAAERRYDTDGKVSIDIFPINYGKSPALHVMQTGVVLYGSYALREADDFFGGIKDFNWVPDPQHSSETIIPPFIPSDLRKSDKFFTERTNEIISSDGDSLLRKESMGYIVVARIRYSDMFGNIYWTDYCSGFLANGIPADCAKHNEMH